MEEEMIFDLSGYFKGEVVFVIVKGLIISQE